MPWPDRLGDQLAGQARDVVIQARRLGPDQRGVALVVASLVLFLVLVAVLGRV
ncbi:MAG: hypothetical protein JOZ82_12460 [Marmoricola sp.]|nr:hypothetical protein [Marmoricola sp.]